MHVLSSTPKIALRSLPRHGLLHRQGDPATAAHWLAAGSIKLVRQPESGGRDLILGLGRAPAWVGLAACLLGERHETSALCLEPCTVGRLSTAELDELIGTGGTFARDVCAALGSELHALYRKVSELHGSPARTRVASALAELLPAEPLATTGQSFAVPLCLWELAQLVGITPEHLSRVLSTFQSAGLVRRFEGRLELLDIARLRVESGSLDPD